MKTKKDILNSESGFTLIEVMVAAMIFVVGILGVLSMFSSTIGANSLGRRMMEATSYASDSIEYLKNVPFTNLSTLGNSTDYCYHNRDPVCQSTNVSGAMTRTATTSWTNLDGLMSISVKVEWTTGSGSTKDVTLNTSRFED